METILPIIIKYWVEFILGLIVAGGGFFIRRYIKMSKKEQENAQTASNNALQERICEENKKIVEEVKNISQKGDEELQQQVDDLNVELKALKAGMLSMQRKSFIAECHRLLAEDHVITLDEWEDIDIDHQAYNGLGGNHRGDDLFKKVDTKFNSGLSNKIS